MNILDTIIRTKQEEIQKKKAKISITQLEQSPFFSRKKISLVASLTDKNATGIIAEFKRKSPSKSIINETANIETITDSYQKNGASAVSVLTDERYFGGSETDLKKARKILTLPILRKDFIIDIYQVIEAKAMGADVILLIASCLSSDKVRELATFAKTLDLEVILEIHTPDELSHICPETNLIGVNNRNLTTFSTDINTSFLLAEKIPGEKIKIAESGINSPKTICTLKKYGFKGFLIGETFMSATQPEQKFADFMNRLKPQ